MTDMSSEAITERLRRASRVSDLAPDKRLDAKLDMSTRGVTQRLQEASDLLRLCSKLASAKR